MGQKFLLVAFILLFWSTTSAQQKKPVQNKKPPTTQTEKSPSKEETIKYINNTCKKAESLTYINNSGEKFYVKEISFFEYNDEYIIGYYTNTLERTQLGDNQRQIMTDLTAIDRIELSPNQRYDSPVRFLRIYFKSKAVALRINGQDLESRDYFSLPLLYSEETLNKIIKAINHLAELDKQKKANDPFK